MDTYDRFRFEYDPAVVRYGTGCVDELAAELAEGGFERALVVCGATVGNTPAVVDPVREGLGDRLAGVFAETTPEKRLGTAYDGLEAMRARDADVLVGLGGGSSLDVTKVISVLAATDRDPRTVGREFVETGTISIPDGPLAPVVAIPTTLAGADLTSGAGLTADPETCPVDEPASGGVGDPRLMPRAVVYDPALYATTPASVLAGSAMNGFDKGIETLYARNRTPVTDATAVRGLERLGPGLRRLGEEGPEPAVLEPVVEGLVLVQYGISRPRGTSMSLIHAFGHGLTGGYEVQQGAAHAVIAPHVLRYVFEHVDGRRDLLARALGVGDAGDAGDTAETGDAVHAGDTAEAVVEAVAEVRDALGLPARLRDVSGPEPGDFPAVAEAVVEDSFVPNAPPGIDLTADDAEAILREAY